MQLSVAFGFLVKSSSNVFDFGRLGENKLRSKVYVFTPTTVSRKLTSLSSSMPFAVK